LVVSIPLKNMSSSDWIIIPAIGENKKCSKPPTSRWFVSIETPSWQYSHKQFVSYQLKFPTVRKVNLGHSTFQKTCTNWNCSVGYTKWWERLSTQAHSSTSSRKVHVYSALSRQNNF
jgi:hypothetical protein